MNRLGSVIRSTVAAAIALAAVPAFAGAAATEYGPADTGWTGRTSSEGLCVPLLLCPAVNNQVESATGAPGTDPGYISTGGAWKVLGTKTHAPCAVNVFAERQSIARKSRQLSPAAPNSKTPGWAGALTFLDNWLDVTRRALSSAPRRSNVVA